MFGHVFHDSSAMPVFYGKGVTIAAYSKCIVTLITTSGVAFFFTHVSENNTKSAKDEKERETKKEQKKKRSDGPISRMIENGRGNSTLACLNIASDQFTWSWVALQYAITIVLRSILHTYSHM